MAMIRNLPTPEGREFGKELDRLLQPELEKLRALGQEDERCASCAFRGGTVPNGCVTTGMDAMKSVLEQTPFLCHSVKPSEEKPCFGWMAAVSAKPHAEPVICPWPFSYDEETT